MEYTFRSMNEIYAKEIVNWHYEDMYGFYDMEQDIEDMEEFLTPQSWVSKYYAVTNDDELIGYFCFEQEDEIIHIGLGLKPDLTGKGYGKKFIEAGLEFSQEKYNISVFRLSVATFNKRAIKLYKSLGFESDGLYISKTNGGQYEFLRMIKKN